MTNNLPHITAAAILGHDGHPITLPPPARHKDIESHMVNRLGYDNPVGGERGFLLSDGSFAGRAVARLIAEKQDQLLPTAQKSDELHSEDLW